MPINISVHGTDYDTLIRVIFAFMGLILYFGLSIYGMILFAQKMYELTKMRRSTIVDTNDNINEQQAVLLYATTKYMTLLTLAMVSSWISSSYMLGINIRSFDLVDAIGNEIDASIALSITCIDSVFNVICLYLQYPMAKDYYDKYCICLGNFCTYLMTKNALKQKEQRHETLASVEFTNEVNVEQNNDKNENVELMVNQ